MRRLIVCTLVLAFVFTGCADREDSPFDPSADTVAPQLESVALVEEADPVSGVVSAYLEWSSNEPSRVAVEYGANASEIFRHSYSLERAFQRSGRVKLVAAEAGAQYAYQLRMWDRAGNSTETFLESMPVLAIGATVGAEPTLLLAMVDVGWGDALYLEAPDGTNVLIDAGHPIDGFVVREFLERKGISRLDFASLTHVHEDHIGGFYGDTFIPLNGLFRITEAGSSEDPIPVGVFLDIEEKTVLNGPYGNLLGALEQHPDLGDHVFLRYGATDTDTPELRWGDGVGVTLLAAGRKAFLDPDYAIESNPGSVINNDSMVYRVQFGAFVAILTGDAEFATEQFLRDHYTQGFLQATLLKLGHHGSNDSSSDRYVEFVDPMVGFISNAVSENPGVEHPFVLNRLRNRGIDYYASDRAIPNRPRELPGVRGDLLVYTDGEAFTIVAENVRYE